MLIRLQNSSFLKLNLEQYQFWGIKNTEPPPPHTHTQKQNLTTVFIFLQQIESLGKAFPFGPYMIEIREYYSKVSEKIILRTRNNIFYYQLLENFHGNKKQVLFKVSIFAI